MITAFSSLGATLKSVTMNYTAPADAIYNVIISKGCTLLTVLFHIIKASLLAFLLFDLDLITRIILFNDSVSRALDV